MRGGFNPNASSWAPGGGQPYAQGNYNYPPQPYAPPGVYDPNAGPYYPQQYQQQYPQQYGQPPAGYPSYGNPQYGGYPPQQPQYGMPPSRGGYQQAAPVAQHVPQPAPVDEKPDPKLQLGGKREVVVPPKKGGGKTFSLFGKPAEQKPKEEATPQPEAKTSPAPATASPAPADAPVPEEPKSPVPTTPTDPEGGATEKAVEKVAEKPKPKKAQKEYKRDPRPHFNIVFCGHVDSGKSTISGRLLADFGQVDEREWAKLKQQAEHFHREGWEYAYVMDVSEEERERGKTHETGAAYLETEARRITILDAPGHKAFVPSMIGGATQADIAVLVISAFTGEFETGYEKGGQTREHALLLKTCGVRYMLCVVNKMDSCGWSKDRYDEILGKLGPFLQQNGYSEKSGNLVFLPASGLTGKGLKTPVPKEDCDWYTGRCMLDIVNSLELPMSKKDTDTLAVPLAGSYKDDGKFFAYGKVESGSLVVGDRALLLPTRREVIIDGLQVESTEIEKAYPGDNIHVRLRNIDEGDVHPGFVLVSPDTNLKAVDYFQARIVVLEVKNILSAGTKCMMHVHSAAEEVSFHKILATIDKKTSEVINKEPAFVRAGDHCMVRLEVARSLVVEPQKDFDKLGRFILRDEGKTIAIGLVTKLYETKKGKGTE